MGHFTKTCIAYDYDLRMYLSYLSADLFIYTLIRVFYVFYVDQDEEATHGTKVKNMLGKAANLVEILECPVSKRLHTSW